MKISFFVLLHLATADFRPVVSIVMTGTNADPDKNLVEARIEFSQTERIRKNTRNSAHPKAEMFSDLCFGVVALFLLTKREMNFFVRRVFE